RGCRHVACSLADVPKGVSSVRRHRIDWVALACFLILGGLSASADDKKDEKDSGLYHYDRAGHYLARLTPTGRDELAPMVPSLDWCAADRCCGFSPATARGRRPNTASAGCVFCYSKQAISCKTSAALDQLGVDHAAAGRLFRVRSGAESNPVAQRRSAVSRPLW